MSTVQARYVAPGDVLMLPHPVEVLDVQPRAIRLADGRTIHPRPRARLRFALLVDVSTAYRQAAVRSIR